MNHYTTTKTDNGFEILKNGVIIKTPLGKDLCVPSEGLANAVSEELSEHCKKITSVEDYKAAMAKMPMFRMAMGAIDIVSERKDEIIEELVSKIDNDIICYRSDNNNELEELENENWNPCVEWFNKRFDSFLAVKHGISFIEQSNSLKERLRKYLHSLSPFVLSGISQCVSDTDSLIISLMLFEKEIDHEKAFKLSVLEEEWQTSKWGKDILVRKKHEELKSDLALCARFISV